MLNKNKNIVVEQVDQEYILFDSVKNTIFVLNQTAYELWIRCENISQKEVINQFLEMLDSSSVETVGKPIIENECNKMIDDFKVKGLLEV